ncbi:flagellar biosynthesis protein FlhB [Tepidimicrobium xylanilyticum]|uniref:Flagellar biosynthetic protein FlhB n=1 Tax=Tepidimicrobium xylanilyticum TaxID=1123352 RepID=A0A1H2YF84_9FIRM|nr:flagellar biosynthesis protein FlhB [Tepidimicrobium xylanilyticum]GMG97123.1 flagellar biosynthetic protein FlhB [Tepidimicrobium xylanilyticum]SDX03671.1 flagellar biosynthetic protein FlhB [Tepidimicrobium xylanilyticum]
MNYTLDLQLFANGEKTEKATPKKRREAREEGQVLQSREVTATFILLISFLGIKIFGKYFLSYMLKFIKDIYEGIENVDQIFYENNLMINFVKVISAFAILVGPITFISFIAGLVINYLQIGFLFTTKPLKINLNRLNPAEGLKRLFSKRSLVELVKSILKIVLIGYIAYSYINKNMLKIINLPKFELLSFLSNFSSLLFGFSIRIVGALVIISIADYFFQWREYEKNLMMTKQEVKEEFKQTEGDPLIKSKIREKQRKIAMSRMMQDVPKADVIITNPTHIAVAIEYDRNLYEAPYVLAKGMDVVAENIKKVGEEHSIPIVENKPLARALYETVEIGDLIPEELYEAVAEVLAYVYSLKDEFRRKDDEIW